MAASRRRLSQLVTATAATAAGEAEAKVLDRLGSHRIDLYHAEQHDPALFAESVEASPARRGLAAIDDAAVEQFARDGFLVVEVCAPTPPGLSQLGATMSGATTLTNGVLLPSRRRMPSRRRTSPAPTMRWTTS